MGSQHSGDLIDAGAYSVDELREAVFAGRGRVGRSLALALLSRKKYPDKVSDLQKVLLDEAEQPRLRALAASALGQIDAPASVGALERGLETREPVTLRGVAKALANVGSRKHVEMLEALAREPGPVGTDAQRAVSVLTRRLKLAPPAERAEIMTIPVQTTADLAPIRVRAATAGEVANAIKTLPTRTLASRGAVAMDCQGHHLVFVFDEASLGQGIDMLERGGEVGIVARPPRIEATEWSARYLVSVEPHGQAKFRVIVTTLEGRPVLAGRGKRRDREATFELAAADVPGALPVEIHGRFDGQKLTFERARRGVQRQPSRTPPAAGRGEN
jgi:HEAT repeat protein